MQRCLSARALDVDVGAAVEKELHDGCVAFARGVVEGCFAVGVGTAVDRDAFIEEEAHEGFEALSRGPAEGVGSEGECVEGGGYEGVEVAAGQDEGEEVVGGGEEFGDEEEELGWDVGEGYWCGGAQRLCGFGHHHHHHRFFGRDGRQGRARDRLWLQITGGADRLPFRSKRGLAGLRRRRRRRRADKIQQAVSLDHFLPGHLGSDRSF